MALPWLTLQLIPQLINEIESAPAGGTLYELTIEIAEGGIGALESFLEGEGVLAE